LSVGEEEVRWAVPALRRGGPWQEARTRLALRQERGEAAQRAHRRGEQQAAQAGQQAGQQAARAQAAVSVRALAPALASALAPTLLLALLRGPRRRAGCRM
jgi:hypothetical protein